MVSEEKAKGKDSFPYLHVCFAADNFYSVFQIMSTKTHQLFVPKDPFRALGIVLSIDFHGTKMLAGNDL